MACFFRTVDNGIKLSSLVSIPDVTDVPAMNKITSNELNRLVTHEDTPKASQPILGHLLTQIFQSFTIPLPDVSNLKIPFGKILHHNQRINEKFSSTSPDTLLTPPENGSTPAGVDSGSDSEDNATQETTHEENFAAFLNAFASCLSRSQSELVAMRFATGTWSAANAQKALPGSAIKRKPDIVLSDDISAKWGNIRVSAELTHSRYQPAMRLGKAADTHAYIMMSEQPWRRFALILSFTNKYRHLRVLMYDHSGGAVSPRFDIYTQPNAFLHIIAAIMFGSLECVGYDTTVSFSRIVSPPRSKDIHGYHPIRNTPAQRSSTTDHAVTTSSSDSLPNPDVSSGEALESVVSDDSDESSSDSAHDSTEESPSALHDSMDEENSSPPQPTATRSAPLLSLISQIPQAEMTESIYSVTPLPSQFPYSTQSPEPCGKIRVGEKIYTIKRILLRPEASLVAEPHVVAPLHMFRTLKEFVRALRDIVKILQTAVEEHQILHRDCSLNNTMILDELGSSEGFLIDWEGPHPLATEWRKALADNMIHPVTFSTILGILNSHLNKLPDDEELATTVNMLKNDAAVLADRFKGKQLASESFSVVEPKRQKSHHTGDTESDSASGSDA
ncbi:hypothetical protein DFJ58DRAFT_725554 [Suillus subalutaceus]|uniref:uncharacterized protein n=1 Tax=Suillus subalutaceus TaxID=48586 RepID=UPI001B879852|nr:uncharacterized protein DFJ58DRAFT_725554 [Suillus subalutaceus]KAG1862142.1 hypothetical protein DFJ58DRAFT_725554 [Suillus subalutaceus]